jgi:hypothetical protein
MTGQVPSNGATKGKVSMMAAVRRANSAFRYWSYRRDIGNPIRFRLAIAEWFRRLAFELRMNR